MPLDAPVMMTRNGFTGPVATLLAAVLAGELDEVVEHRDCGAHGGRHAAGGEIASVHDQAWRALDVVALGGLEGARNLRVHLGRVISIFPALRVDAVLHRPLLHH